MKPFSSLDLTPFRPQLPTESTEPKLVPIETIAYQEEYYLPF